MKSTSYKSIKCIVYHGKETCKGIAHKGRLQIIRSDISGKGLYTINLVVHKW